MLDVSEELKAAWMVVYYQELNRLHEENRSQRYYMQSEDEAVEEDARRHADLMLKVTLNRFSE